MAIQIRTMMETDVKAVSNLSGQLGYPQPEAATAAHIVAVLNSPDDCAFVASEAQNIVGWIHGFKTRRIETGMFAEIGGLVVDDAFRGKGIGKLLVEAVREWCLQQGLHTLKVRSNVIRTDAHRFYGREGFSESKEQKVFEQHI
jgi:GNAT superfamily N-acetyltransferase